MKKMLALVLVLVLVLGSFPVFADEMTFGEMLAQMALVKGDGEGNLMEGDALTRAQMMVILARMYGVEEEAETFVLPSTFTDVSVDSYYAPFIAYAQMEGWTVGYGDGTFGPDDPLTADQAATFLLRVLGYSSDEDFEWDEAVEFAASLGIDVTGGVGDEGEILRGEIFEMMYKALYTENTEGVLLAVVLGYEEPEPESLEVVSVLALNLVQIEVVFNTEVDEDSAEDYENNYAVEDEDYDLVSASLQEDGKTVILYLDTTDAEDRQQEESLVTIEDVFALDDEDMTVPDTEMTVQFLDMDIPVATGVENIGINAFKVHFSEPMNTMDLEDTGNYEVKNENGKKFYLKDAVALTDDLSARIETFSDLTAGEYTIEVSGIEDYAGFTAMGKTFTVEVDEDTEAPYVVGYKDAEPKSVTLIWNEDIKPDGEWSLGLDFEEIYHTNVNNVAIEVTVTENEMELVFSEDEDGNLLPEGTAYVYVLEEMVEDYWENENDQQMVKVEVDIDMTPPAVENVEVETEQQIIITFTEDIDIDDDDYELTLLDDTGKDESDLIDGSSASGDELTVDFEEDLNGDYSLIIEGLYDTAIPSANEMPTTTVEFEVADETAPFGDDYPTAKTYNAGDEDQLILVDFGEAMSTSGTYAITSLANYMLHEDLIVASDGVEMEIDSSGYFSLEDLEDIVSIEVVSDGEAVEIYLNSLEDDDEEYVTLTTSVIASGLKVGRLADAADNYTLAFETAMTVGQSGFVEVDTVEAVATDTVEVTLEDALVDIDGDDFKFMVSGSAVEYTFEDDFGLDYDEDADGNTVLIFEFFDEVMNYKAEDWTSNGTIYFVVMDDGSENQYGEPVEEVTQAVLDAIKPEIVVFDDGDDEYDVVFNYMTTYGAFEIGADETTYSVIEIFFEEAIDPMSVSLDTFEVGGGDYEVLAVYVEGINKEIGDPDRTTYGVIALIVENEDADDMEGVKVDQQSAIRDLVGNVTTGIKTEIVDIEAVMPWLEDFAEPS